MMITDDKMIVVVVVAAIILVGLAGFLFYLERRLAKAERQMRLLQEGRERLRDF